MPFHLGIDSGGTSTRAMLVNEAGQVLFTGQAGSANFTTSPPRLVRQNLEKATAGCPEPDTVCLCAAGILTKANFLQAGDLLAELFPKAKHRVTPDYYAAYASFDPPVCVCVISGTGSVVCSSGEHGVAKSGGGGFAIGDDGSAFRFGRAALRHFLDDPDECSCRVLQAIEKRFGTTEPAEVIAKVYGGRTVASQVAKFARPLAKDAADGLPYATEALRSEFQALASIVAGHVHRFLPPKTPLSVGLSGGLWEISLLFQRSFEQELGQALPQRELQVRRPSKPPVYGAAKLAMNLL